MECVMSFSCEKCNYSTPYKHSYERHLQSTKHLEASKENIVCFSCDLCKYSTPDKSNYERHLKSVKHFHKTKPTELQIMRKMSQIWAKYVTRQTPDEEERDCVYQYFDRNWEEMIGDMGVSSRVKPPYTSKKDFDEIWKKTCTAIVPLEEQIEEV